jgi:hypothetical protein
MYSMTNQQIASGTVHELPADLRKALMADASALEKWQSLTPLARNEWICWTITVKQAATRKNHVERTVSQLLEGQRRPCCWIGCIHRPDKAISPSIQWVLDRQAKSK